MLLRDFPEHLDKLARREWNCTQYASHNHAPLRDVGREEERHIARAEAFEQVARELRAALRDAGTEFKRGR